jgi:aminopeptidase YwaD
MKTTIFSFIFLASLFLYCPIKLVGQSNALETPLKQEILDILSNEISGQVIYNNMVAVSGAPWLRDEAEFTDTFYESAKMYELVKSYGIETVRLDRSGSDREFDYAVEAELWITKPRRKLIARLDADAALVARGSQSVDFSGELIYIPPVDDKGLSEILDPLNRDKYKGKVALMWSHARGELATVLDSVGVRAIISFSSRDRYFDPNMVVYSSGSYSTGKNLKAGYTISWRQWSELLEDIEFGEQLTIGCLTLIEKKQDKFEAVFSWIPGTEPEKPGIIFTAHLFEGYTKRGANDNTGGCVVQLEILRSLSSLIKEGVIQQPRRNIYFLWPNEISGTYKFISENPDIISNTCININMDMVSEGLRKNNSWLTMGESPAQLSSFYDGLANSVLNYVWRSNDIVYLSDSPRGRRGGQYFPKPMLEKNGSVDAFRYYMHEATGGSDHLCFNNSAVAVPGIEFFTWPDYWYHADTDTPDKGDPTQMKRIAFVGAATAYAAANCTDEVLPGLIQASSDFGYKRFAERGLSRSIALINSSTKVSLKSNSLKATKLVEISATREIAAIESIREISTSSPGSVTMLDNSVQQWNDYRSSMVDYIVDASQMRAEELGVSVSGKIVNTKLKRSMESLVPKFSEDIMYKIFSPSSYQPFVEFIEANPKSPGVAIANSRDARTLLAYISGEITMADIIDYAVVFSGKEYGEKEVFDYFELLKKVGYLDY